MIKNAKIVGCDIPYEYYHRQEPDASRGNPTYIMSRGEIVNFAECPARWLAGYKADSVETESTKWGSLIDCLITGEDQFNSLFAVAPATYPDAKTGEPKPWTGAANFCKAWKKDQGDKTIIKSEMKADADLAVKAIRENELVAELFSVSSKQVMIVAEWHDEATGVIVPIRGLLDLVPPKDHPIFAKWLCDFKTARNGNPASWDRAVSDHGYDVQAALYLDLFISATHEDRVDFVHVVQENVFPFHVTSPLMAMSSEFLSWGRSKYTLALRAYCECLKYGTWPSFMMAGVKFGHTQIIGPDALYAYRSMAGMPAFKMPEEPEEKQETTNDDLTP